MKFDAVRAWKDDTYRQSLSNEQLSKLPANPAGELELSETDLASVSGGYGRVYNRSESLTITREDFHSYALICDVNIFSVQTNVLSDLLSATSPIAQVCVSHD
ncbi:MAG TPA: mersacidin/lichenicidin family type 2 lantibiotic [Ktedonobacteraceae bacterium]|jgi:mersacidin/lichenicidin family type 2 lantibiotic|nr:mersacidin/lichenicidin family type 2 lantibiotic [Ktedonobacteraceae bacterium]